MRWPPVEVISLPLIGPVLSCVRRSVCPCATTLPTLDPSHLSDDDLLRRLRGLLPDSRRTECDLVAHIGEVDARRLYAREASPSMFKYCTRTLHLSGAEAYFRITAARAARVYP